MLKPRTAALILVPLLAACSESTGPEGTARVQLRFATVAPVPAAPSAAVAPTSGDLATALIPIPAEGGEYEVEDVQLIVSEIELEGPETCIEEEEEENGEIESEHCEFEGGPRRVDLPLEGGVLTVATDWITEGIYTFVEFEVEDLEMDDDDGDDAAKQAALEGILADIRVDYPDFPAGASMVVSGRFVPDTGDPQPFTVYFEAEIEIELALDPPLEVPADDAMVITVDPVAWLTGIDLLALDGQTVEFELEMEHGFVEAEADHDHDD